MKELFERIERWMMDHGAKAIAANLSPAAKKSKLDRLEKKLGFPLGDELRALWSVHDGQREEGLSFWHGYDLVSTARARPEDVLRFLPLLREPASARGARESKLRKAELGSNAWVRFAGQDADGLAVNTESGRVFVVSHDDDPALRLLAPSITAWLGQYADALEAGAYEVDAAGEVAKRAPKRRRGATEKKTAGTSSRTPRELLAEAIAKGSEERAQRALARAPELVATLFAKASPAFVASTLRPTLNQLVLTKAQWQVIVKGAKEIENNAIHAIAERKLSELWLRRDRRSDGASRSSRGARRGTRRGS